MARGTLKRVKVRMKVGEHHPLRTKAILVIAVKKKEKKRKMESLEIP